MNVKNIKSFIDFYKSLEISNVYSTFSKILNNENQKKPFLKKLTHQPYRTTITKEKTKN